MQPTVSKVSDAFHAPRRCRAGQGQTGADESPTNVIPPNRHKQRPRIGSRVGLLAALVGLYIYKQQNPDYDPWEEPWENSSSPVDLGLNKAEDEADDEAKAAPAEA